MNHQLIKFLGKHTVEAAKGNPKLPGYVNIFTCTYFKLLEAVGLIIQIYSGQW